MQLAVATLGIFAVLVSASTPVGAVTVRAWEIANAEAFGRGTLNGTEVDAEGRLRIAPEFRTVWGPDEGIVWAVAADGNGGTFVALSNPGRLLRIDAGGEASTWYEESTGGMLTALAPDGEGGAYIGISVIDGRVLHARGPDEVELVGETDTVYVWALHVDESGTLWAGTGAPGQVLSRVAGEGWETALSTGDDPVRCLTSLPGGTIVAGTGLEARVIRIGADGGPFVLFDGDQDEIVSLATTDTGRIYALAAGPRKKSGPPGPGPQAPRRNGASAEVVRVTPPPDPDEPEAEEAPEAGPRPPSRPPRPTRPGGALYRLDPEGGYWKIWESSTELPFAVVADAEGFPVIGTGERGRIVRMDPEGTTARVLRFPSEMATALSVADDGRILVGGAMDARLAEIGPGYAEQAVFVSEGFDARSVSEWGRIRWDADRPSGTRVRVRVRAGNTAEPDETWSPWIDVEPDPVGSEAEIEAPPAQRLQVELTLEGTKKGSSPLVRSVEIFYQPRNRPPGIQEVKVNPPGEAWLRAPQQSSASRGPLVTDDPVARQTAATFRPRRGGGAPVRKSYEPGARTFSWKAGDPDGDPLVYTLEIRREGETAWRPLADAIEDTFHSWDGRGLPDGHYRVRLTADDRKNNALGRGFAIHAVSDPFVVDNTPPSIGEVEVEATDEGFRIRFDATDPGGRIAAVELATDNGSWSFLEPVDGVSDSDVESYEVVFPRAGGGSDETDLRLRVTDVAGNVGGTRRELGSR
jgi:hypothetical protein